MFLWSFQNEMGSNTISDTFYGYFPGFKEEEKRIKSRNQQKQELNALLIQDAKQHIKTSKRTKILAQQQEDQQQQQQQQENQRQHNFQNQAPEPSNQVQPNVQNQFQQNERRSQIQQVNVTNKSHRKLNVENTTATLNNNLNNILDYETIEERNRIAAEVIIIE